MTPRNRLARLWTGLPLIALVGCAILTVLAAPLEPVELRRAIVVGIAVGVWHCSWALARPEWFEVRLLPMAVYFTGLLVLTDHLAGLSVTFFPLFLVCYPMAFVALPGGWAFVGVGATAALSLFSRPWSAWTVETVAIEVGAAALVSVAGGAIRALEAEADRRRAAMVQTAAARDQLQHALTENLALHERLVAEARDSGMRDERSRLAAEIHDTLAAGLSGIVSQLEATDAGLSPDDPLRRRVRMSCDLARESLQEARRSVRAMRPGPLIDSLLPEALRTAVARFGGSHPIAVSCHITGVRQPIDPAVEDALLRAAGEALTNADRHACASEVHVTLSYFDGHVALDVADNGTGFNSEAVAEGYGLSIMRDRAAALGGQMSITSTPAQGTTVTLLLPYASSRGETGAAQT